MDAATRITRAAETIQAAFADVPYPGDNGIGKRVPGSNVYTSLETGSVEAFFAGRHWTEINWDVLWHEYEGQASACPTFMTPAAFRYYLPAYMLMALQGIDVVDMLASSTVQNLIPRLFPDTGDAEGDGRLGRNIRELTIEQRAAVAAFLLAMQEAYREDFSFVTGPLGDDSPMRALNDYWERFLPEADRHLVEHESTT